MDPRLFTLAWPWLLSFGLPLLVLALLGQDVNWDLRNYHLYNPHAWLNGRFALDIAPAQLQTWHNPLLDVPLYLLSQPGWSSAWSSLWLAVPAMISLRMLIALSNMVADSTPDPLRQALVCGIAISGAGSLQQIGSSFNGWFVTAAVLAALVCLVRDREPGALRPTFVAGWLLGAITGLKLTAAVCCLGAGAALLILGAGMPRKALFLSMLSLTAGGIAGFALTYGFWGVKLWTTYGNPFFPYFNNWFESPFASIDSWNDPRFRFVSVRDALLVPVRLLTPSTRYSELALTDPRLLLGLTAIVSMIFRKRHPRTERSAQRHYARRYIVVFVLVVSLLWAAISGVYRYLLPVELLCAVLLCEELWMTRKGYPRALVGTLSTIALVGFTHVQGLERQPFGGTVTEMSMPRMLLGDDMVVTASGHPLAYVATELPNDVPMIALFNSFMRPGQCTRLQASAEKRVRNHRGPLWLVDPDPSAAGQQGATLADYGIRIAERCQEIPSRFGMLWFCRLDHSNMRAACVP